jgi:hypothetical protein
VYFYRDLSAALPLKSCCSAAQWGRTASPSCRWPARSFDRAVNFLPGSADLWEICSASCSYSVSRARSGWSGVQSFKFRRKHPMLPPPRLLPVRCIPSPVKPDNLPFAPTVLLHPIADLPALRAGAVEAGERLAAGGGVRYRMRKGAAVQDRAGRRTELPGTEEGRIGRITSTGFFAQGVFCLSDFS